MIVSDGVEDAEQGIPRVTLTFCTTAVVPNVGISQRFPGSAPLLTLPTIWNQLGVNLVTQVFNEICIIHGQFCRNSMLFGL